MIVLFDRVLIGVIGFGGRLMCSDRNGSLLGKSGRLFLSSGLERGQAWALICLTVAKKVALARTFSSRVNPRQCPCELAIIQL